MGRPKEHDARTGAALLDAAEHIVEQEGLAALTVRRVADEVGTTTRAVYSVFGSKEALIVALGARAFELLAAGLDAAAATEDPVADLVEAGAGVFRRLAVERPTLFKTGVQHSGVGSELAGQFRTAADDALTRLVSRLTRLRDAGLLGERNLHEAACQFHALCEGLAAIELRGALPLGDEERIWRDAFTALVTGFAAAAPK
jgi:AcrR family transcriptional regulator